MPGIKWLMHKHMRDDLKRLKKHGAWIMQTKQEFWRLVWKHIPEYREIAEDIDQDIDGDQIKHDAACIYLRAPIIIIHGRKINKALDMIYVIMNEGSF